MSNINIINEIVEVIKDYRLNEIEKIDSNHVLKWVNQFDDEFHNVILEETLNFLKKRYINRIEMYSFYKENLLNIFGSGFEENPNDICLLNIQKYGTSQNDLVDLMKEVLLNEKNIMINSEYKNKKNFIYLDEGIFSGNRILNDLIEFVTFFDLKDVRIHALVVVSHTAAEDYLDKKLNPLMNERNIDFRIWRWIVSSNFNNNYSGVFKPKEFPLDSLPLDFSKNLIDSYNQKGIRFPFLRFKDDLCNQIFSSNKNRDIVESQFLKYGIWILNTFYQEEKIRPLGFTKFLDLGFGAAFFSYRNVPNNCPIVLWFNKDELYYLRDKTESWLPLFPRKISRENTVEYKKTKGLF